MGNMEDIKSTIAAIGVFLLLFCLIGFLVFHKFFIACLFFVLFVIFVIVAKINNIL